MVVKNICFKIEIDNCAPKYFLIEILAAAPLNVNDFTLAPVSQT